MSLPAITSPSTPFVGMNFDNLIRDNDIQFFTKPMDRDELWGREFRRKIYEEEANEKRMEAARVRTVRRLSAFDRCRPSRFRWICWAHPARESSPCCPPAPVLFQHSYCCCKALAASADAPLYDPSALLSLSTLAMCSLMAVVLCDRSFPNNSAAKRSKNGATSSCVRNKNEMRGALWRTNTAGASRVSLRCASGAMSFFSSLTCC